MAGHLLPLSPGQYLEKLLGCGVSPTPIAD
jgi:hypothetical protein